LLLLPNSRILTINGLAQDLSTDRSWTISTGLTVGTTPIASGTVGRVLFEGTGNVLQQSSNLTFDNVTGLLTVTGGLTVNGGTTIPHIRGNALRISNTANGAIGSLRLGSVNNIEGDLGMFTFLNDTTRLVRFFSNGNVGINQFTDAGFRLDVNGTARVQGLMRSTEVFVIGGTATTNTANARFWSTGGQAPTSGFFRALYADTTWIPSSGNAEYYALDLRFTINQTGGANGVSRGLYIAPTLTSAFDFRAIEVVSGGAYINTTSVNASAILQADSTTKGFLPPRMTTTQKNAIASPAAGLMVYDTTLNVISYYNGTSWI